MAKDGFDFLSEGCIREEFKEYEEIKAIISSVVSIYGDSIAVEMAMEKFQFVVDEYQEQPHLLDPHLESLLGQLLDIAKKPNEDAAVILAFRMMYHLTKCRGYKVIVRLLPHEVADLEPVLALLNKHDRLDFSTWEARYMLLLWLSIVSMIPFDMVRLDSNIKQQSGEVRKPIMDRIIDVGKMYMDVVDKSRDAGAYMLAKFLTRPDVKKAKLPEVLDWALVTLTSANLKTLPGMTCVSGVLSMLASLFKYGKREDLVDYAPIILKKLNSLKMEDTKNTLLRKLTIKMIQRIGLIFLKARQAAWRYQRGSRSLASNLAVKDSAVASSMTNQSLDIDMDEDYEIPEEMEDVIELLLKGLRDKDTVVRWSAAKGIGRVTGRLPRELADDVVGSIMELFTLQESDAAWHGGCLSLAELGRRGLLLPERLQEVVPVIIKALSYDQKRGSFSVGAHVREAACYVCWAFAKAYDPTELAPHVNQIANALVIVSIFDREVNVRRAAAAAFQENVGRQGQFPHGIEILTTCDYFAVGNRTGCYQELSVFVAQFPEYTSSLIEHLVSVKIGHWDSGMRQLSAQALHNLTPKAPDLMAQNILGRLVEISTGIDLCLRHGAILAVAEVTQALALHAAEKQQGIETLIEQAVINGLKEIAPKLWNAKLFRGHGGELMRVAVCTLIRKLSLSKMPFYGDAVIETWQELIDDCLQHLEPDIQEAAFTAIPTLFEQYYKLPDGKPNPEMQEKILAKYLKELKNPIENTRMGYVLALGMMPKFMFSGRLQDVIEGIKTGGTLGTTDKKMAEFRRDSLKALTSVCECVGVCRAGSPNEVLCADNIPGIYECLLAATQDYTLDSRGDVGAWVREAAMSGLHDLTSMLCKRDPSFITEDISKRMFCCLVQQACEKIDRTRQHAGEIFEKLLNHKPEVPHIPHREELLKIVLYPEKYISRLETEYMKSPEKYISSLLETEYMKSPEKYNSRLETEYMKSEINWSVPNVTFPLFVELLQMPTYTRSILLGLTVSVGGLTESLVKYSASAFFNYLRRITQDKEQLTGFSQHILAIMESYKKVDRITLPLFKMLDQLLANGCFSIFAEQEESHTFPMTLLTLTRAEVAKSGDPQKLMASIDVYCGLLQFQSNIQRKTLQYMVLFLCHTYPLIRKTTATKLYEAVVMYDGLVPADNLDLIMTLLSESEWDKPVAVVRPLRNQLCDLMDVPKPVLASAKIAKKTAEDGDGNK